MTILKFSHPTSWGLTWNSLTVTGSIEQGDLDEPEISNIDYTDINGLKIHFYYNPISKTAHVIYIRMIDDLAMLRANFLITIDDIHSDISIMRKYKLSFEQMSKFINDVEDCKLQPRTIQFFLQWAGKNEVQG